VQCHAAGLRHPLGSGQRGHPLTLERALVRELQEVVEAVAFRFVEATWRVDDEPPVRIFDIRV